MESYIWSHLPGCYQCTLMTSVTCQILQKITRNHKGPQEITTDNKNTTTGALRYLTCYKCIPCGPSWSVTCHECGLLRYLLVPERKALIRPNLGITVLRFKFFPSCVIFPFWQPLHKQRVYIGFRLIITPRLSTFHSNFCATYVFIVYARVTKNI